MEEDEDAKSEHEDVSKSEIEDAKSEHVDESKSEIGDGKYEQEETSFSKAKSGDDEDEIDIDLNDPDVEAAATKIQAGFKGMKTRKQMRQQKAEETHSGDEEEDDISNRELLSTKEPEPDQLTIVDDIQKSGHEDKQDILSNEDEEGVDIDDVSTRTNSELNSCKSVDKSGRESIADPVIDIDLDDPDIEKAATKIQAGFKGHKVRKQVRARKDEQKVVDITEDRNKVYDSENDQESDKDESETTTDKATAGNKDEIDIDLDDPEVEKAATKIQAGFKGHKTRKQMKQGKFQDEADDKLDDKVQQEEEPGTKDEKEEIDIDLDDPEVAKAATKIQSGFKGHKARKEVREKRKNLEMQSSPQEANANEESNYAHIVESHEDEIEIDLNDPEVELAATRIQAGFKGHKARKTIQKKKEEDKNGEQEHEPDSNEDYQVAVSKDFKGINQDDTKGEEEIDIDLNDPEVEMAATRIQAGFKGQKARKDIKQRKEIIDERKQVPKSLEEFNRKIEDDIVDIDLNDPNVEKAATTIQAGYKGMRTRKNVKGSTSTTPSENMTEKEYIQQNKNEDEEEIDIDLDDPEVAAAATKIQAGYKGMRTRKSMKKNEGDNDGPFNDYDNSVTNNNTATKEEEEVDIDLDDPEVAMAATKIQAGYKGMRTRKQMKGMNYEEKAHAIKDDDDNDVIVGDSEDKDDEEIDIDVNDPEVVMAATKIQAGYKGMQTRKKMRTEDPSDTKVTDNEDESSARDDRNGDSKGEIDIDLEDPEVEKAATKIQAGFKGHKARKEVKSRKLAAEYSAPASYFPPDINSGPGVYNEPKEIDIDLADPEVEKAATKIQAGFKGHKARKRVNKMKESDVGLDVADAGQEASTMEEAVSSNDFVSDAIVREDKEAVIDPDDPEVINAATQIQAGYKGLKARRQVKEMRAQKVEQPCEREEIDIDLNDPEVAMAATKIQAGYKGMRTRKAMSNNEDEAPVDDVIDPEDEEIMDIDFNDPDVEMAATKIQAGFKGMKARKEVRSRRVDQELEAQRVEEEIIDIDLNDPDVEKAATTIQAGYKGFQARNQVRGRRVEMAREVGDSGAVPFEIHQKLKQEEMDIKDEEDDLKKAKEESRASTAGSERMEEGLIEGGDGGGAQMLQSQLSVALPLNGSLSASQSSSEMQKGVRTHPPVMIYHYRGSHCSQKVLMYMYERDIDFTAYHVDLQKDEHLATWYLKINPKGEVPVLKMEDKVLSDSTRILHHLEAQIPVDAHPALVPCTSDTQLYQKHIYFVALIDQVKITFSWRGNWHVRHHEGSCRFTRIEVYILPLKIQHAKFWPFRAVKSDAVLSVLDRRSYLSKKKGRAF